MNGSGGIRVAGVFVHPVKSCRAIALPRAEVDAFGLRHDRAWMVIDAGARFLTQRELPRLSAVSPCFDEDALVLEAPGSGRLRIPLAAPPGKRLEVQVWSHRGPALDEGDEAARWLGEVLGVECRLVRVPPDHARRVNPERFPREAYTAFSDGYPFLVLSRASLDDLNARLERSGAAAVPVDRFRPNLLIEGCEPFAEDAWRRIRIAGAAGAPAVELEIVKPCPRCAITTVDQAAGVARGPEPLRTLATYRRQGDGVMFGQNAVHLGRGWIERGAPVEVLEHRAAV